MATMRRANSSSRPSEPGGLVLLSSLRLGLLQQFLADRFDAVRVCL